MLNGLQWSSVGSKYHGKYYVTFPLQSTIVGIAWSFAAGAPSQARQPRSNSASARSDNAYLIVNRAANFGTRESINLSIDGVEVAVLGLNQA